MFCQEAGYIGTINGFYKVGNSCANIRIDIRRSIIQILIEGTCIRGIIPIATE